MEVTQTGIKLYSLVVSITIPPLTESSQQTTECKTMLKGAFRWWWYFSACLMLLLLFVCFVLFLLFSLFIYSFFKQNDLN